MDKPTFAGASDKPPSLSDWAVDRIREAIVTGEIKPGERLVEAQVASLLGISRAPLREALRTLTRDGLMEQRQNRGAYVVNPSPADLESMALARALAEGASGRLLAARRDPAILDQLARILEEQRAAQSGGEAREVTHLHWEFHRAICAGSGNRHLLDMWSRVSTVLRIYSSSVIYKVAVGNNTVFLDHLLRGTPSEAEAVLRSQILAMSYLSLKAQPPAHVREYITRFIARDGTVHRVETFEVADLVGLAGI